MKLTYIYHSCFVVEVDSITVIFDYWKDPAIIMPSILKKQGTIYILSSHFHEDHFNPEILSWKGNRRDIKYILSKDILRHKRAGKDDGLYLAKGHSYKDNNIYVEAYGSTDSGVSWYIELCGKKIFHAGDLNNWLWLDESTPEESMRYQKMYLGELGDIYKDVKELDLVMFPVDARLGSDYMRGAMQFVDKFKIGLFAPMHFTANPVSYALAFGEYANKNNIRFFSIKKEGDYILF
jgi:hypothetical protein